MELWEFSICMYCVLSGGDISRHVEDNKINELPLFGPLPMVFSIISWIPALAIFALPIYGFIVMPWWQPIVGIFIAIVFSILITRAMLAGSTRLYLWSIGFSLVGLGLFVYFYIK